MFSKTKSIAAMIVYICIQSNLLISKPAFIPSENRFACNDHQIPSGNNSPTIPAHQAPEQILPPTHPQPAQTQINTNDFTDEEHKIKTKYADRSYKTALIATACTLGCCISGCTLMGVYGGWTITPICALPWQANFGCSLCFGGSICTISTAIAKHDCCELKAKNRELEELRARHGAAQPSTTAHVPTQIQMQ